MFYVYKITNKLNGKVYFGKTITLRKRFQQHANNKQKKISVISRAINKYGVDNFIFEKVFESEDQIEALNMEYQLINENDTIVPNGYNILNSKDNRLQFNDDTKLKLSHSVHQLPKMKNTTSTYKGVCITSYGGIIVACMGVDGKTINRTMPDEITAAEAYDRIKLLIHKEHAVLNFPEKLEKYLQEDLSEFYENLVKTKRVYPNTYKYVIYDKDRKKWRSNYQSMHLPDGIITPAVNTEECAARISDYLIIYYKLEIPLNFSIDDYILDDVKREVELYKELHNKRVKHPSDVKGIKYDSYNKKWLWYRKGRRTVVYDSEAAAIDAYDYYMSYRKMVDDTASFDIAPEEIKKLSKTKQLVLHNYTIGYRIIDNINYDPSGKILKCAPNSRGYRRIGTMCLVHHLVALQKYGKEWLFSNKLVMHKDHNKLNNLPENIKLQDKCLPNRDIKSRSNWLYVDKDLNV